MSGASGWSLMNDRNGEKIINHERDEKNERICEFTGEQCEWSEASMRIQFTLSRVMGWVVVAAVAAYLVFEPFPPDNPVVNFVIGAMVSAAFGVGASRHPWLFLALGLYLWTFVPLIDHGEDARSLSVRGSVIGWLIGAPAGWYARRRRRRAREPLPAPMADEGA